MTNKTNLIILFLAIILISCQTNKVKYTLNREPIVDLLQFDLIGVEPVQSETVILNVIFGNMIKDDIEFFNLGATIPESELEIILDNIKYKRELGDFQNLEPLRNFESKIGVIFLDVYNFDTQYRDHILKIERESDLDPEKVTMQNITNRRIVTYIIDLKLTVLNINKAELIDNININSVYHDTIIYYNDNLPETNDILGFMNTSSNGLFQLVKSFSNLSLEVELEFKKYNNMFDKGIKYAKKNELPRAKTFFEEKSNDLEEGEAKSIAYYNLGLCNLFLQNFRKARACFIKAERHFKNEDNNKMQEYNKTLQEYFQKDKDF